VVFLGALEKLEPGGRVRYLVDPRYNHHSAALKLADELLNYPAATSSSPSRLTRRCPSRT